MRCSFQATPRAPVQPLLLQPLRAQCRSGSGTKESAERQEETKQEGPGSYTLRVQGSLGLQGEGFRSGAMHCLLALSRDLLWVLGYNIGLQRTQSTRFNLSLANQVWWVEAVEAMVYV